MKAPRTERENKSGKAGSSPKDDVARSVIAGHDKVGGIAHILHSPRFSAACSPGPTLQSRCGHGPFFASRFRKGMDPRSRVGRYVTLHHRRA